MYSYHTRAISWLMYALKIILGDESIRRYIILYYNPELRNRGKHVIRTFDAFLRNKTTDEKKSSIIQYCGNMCKRKGVVVFTATNIQQDLLDNETHFQSYIINNKDKKLTIIDPAYNRNKRGIYEPEISNEVIIPFFESEGYDCKFIELINPAQKSKKDVYCQSWTLYILLQKLRQNEYLTDNSLDIPEDQLNKYDMLVQFYKQIFNDMPELKENLLAEYEGVIVDSNGPKSLSKNEKEKLLQYDPIDLLMNITKYDIDKIR